MIRGMTLLWGLLAVAAGVAAFMVKYEVQALEDQLAAANARIRHDRAQIHVLEAEWAYLNQPERLRTLAAKHLNLVPLEPTQVITLAALPPNPDLLDEAAPETLLGRAPDGTPVVPWASYPMRKPGSLPRLRAGAELASTGGMR